MSTPLTTWLLADYLRARFALFDAITPAAGNTTLPVQIEARRNELTLLCKEFGLTIDKLMEGKPDDRRT